MSILASIFSKIFPPGHPARVAKEAADAAPAVAPAPAPASTVTVDPTATTSAAQPVSAPAPVAPVDVDAVLTNLASEDGRSLNWRTSIVDLMKLLGLDSSLEDRKELARELHYPGNRDDSATLNVWLHKVVIQKVADNGGKVSEALAR